MDDFNYQHSLNTAHSYARQAENHERSCKLDEAILCHQQAIEHIKKAVPLVTYPRLLESLNLQVEFHKRQKRIVHLKKIQLLLCEKIHYNKKQMKSDALLHTKVTEMEDKNKNLEWAIFRNIETADSLLGGLVGDEGKQPTTCPLPTAGFKQPKDDRIVIEELRTLNAQLRNFMCQLLNELEDSRKEVDQLKEKIKSLESGNVKVATDVVYKTGNFIDFDSSMGSSTEL